MGIAFEIVTILIGIEHLGIMVLEMFASPAKQAKAFDMEESFLRQKAARTSMANQGIYNGLLGVSLIASQFIFLGMTAIMVGRLFLIFVAVVGFYVAFTATKKIWLFQFIPAVIGLILSL